MLDHHQPIADQAVTHCPRVAIQTLHQERDGGWIAATVRVDVGPPRLQRRCVRVSDVCPAAFQGATYDQMLNRRLLYIAVTRAKQLGIIVGNRQRDATDRRTCLALRLEAGASCGGNRLSKNLASRPTAA